MGIEFGASPAGESNTDADPTNAFHASPDASLWGRDWMEKMELGDFGISPSNHRVAEFHRLIKNGHFWGKATPFFSRSPSPSWAVLGAPDLPICYYYLPAIAHPALVW